MLTHKLKFISLSLLAAISFSSCEKALNINDNPNSATYSTPDLVLPQAMVASSRAIIPYNTYGSRIMYYANAGGVSGWGAGFLDYNYSTTNDAGLWSTSYNNVQDYQYVIDNTKDVSELESFYHAAQVMKSYMMANLVDTYNDVPYSEANLGASNLYPKYDKAQDIYVALATNLDAAVAFFKAATLPSSFVGGDPLFKGDPAKWARLANTLKLKLVVKAKGKATFANETIDATVGLLTDDAIVNPVFTKIDGKQNPMWNQWAYAASGAAVGLVGTQFIPTFYIMSFYDGNKLDDEARANVTFGNGISAPKNQLGDLSVSATGLAPSTWTLRPTSGTISATNYRGIGIVKGPAAGQPIMLLAEAKFLAAEAAVRGILTGDPKVLFEDGIKASFNYLNKNETDAVVAGTNATTYLTNYKTVNLSSALVNFDLATTNEQKIEAIITQKYIAFNFLFGHEAWNEFRRTGYPSIIDPSTNQPYPNNTSNARNTFVSIGSVSTSADRLPTRLLYPNTEHAYNQANVPEVDKFTSKIFWAK